MNGHYEEALLLLSNRQTGIGQDCDKYLVEAFQHFSTHCFLAQLISIIRF